MDINTPISKSFVYLAFAISIAALVFAVTLTILLSAQNYVGINGSNSITVTSCGETYYTTKQVGQTQMVGTAFIGTIISLAASIAIFVSMLLWVMKVNADQNIESSLTRMNKIILYLVASVAVMAEIPSCGYYLTDLVEINKCTTQNYNQTQVIVLFVFSLLLLVSSFLYYLLITYAILNSFQSQDKYRDVQSQPTQPNQNDIKQKYYRYEPKEQPKSATPKNAQKNPDHHEHTKENLYQSPTRDPKHFYRAQENPQSRNQYPSNKKSGQQSQMNKYTAQESFHQMSPQKQPRKKQYYGTDNDDFNKEQNRYINRNQGRSILPSDGLQQKPNNEKKNSYFGEGEPRRRVQLSPQKKISRQGQLVRHIRSKYGN